ncbi:Small acidic protein [Mactra antiquata]
MDLLANYEDDNTGENSVSPSPKPNEDKYTSNLAPTVLENEWLSFEQMIAPGGGNSEPMKSSEFLVNGIVAYPGMKSGASTSHDGIPMEDQSSKSSNDETGDTSKQNFGENTGAGNDEDDDAFFRLRKQVKERDRSSSSDGSESSRSSSSSRSPSPPHLSPVNSIKSHMSDPPDLTQLTDDKSTTDGKTKDSETESNAEKRLKDKHSQRSKDRKRSHRDSSSKHDHHSSSKRRRSRSHSKDRKRRSKDHHRRKDKKSRDRRSRRDSRRSRSRDRKDSKSESRKSESHDHKDKKDLSGVNSISERKKSESNETKDSKSERHRSRSGDRKDRKRKRRSRSRSRHRHRSKDRKSKERKRSKSRDRKKKHRSRSRSRDRRSRSRHRDRYSSRSRSRERLRSRSPVLGRKLTFKEQMRKEFINASKEMTQEQHKAAAELDSLRKPGESLRPSDLLKGVKLTGGDSVTPQMALMQTMAAMHKKAQELTGVEVPKYYNPAAVNPLKYAEQVQKRKLLWSKKTEEKDKNEQIESQWKSAFIGGNDDDKAVSKFRKLMGMKGEEGRSSADELPEDMQKMSEEQRRKQAELFQRLDQEYQFARMTTHTQRGVGLGFSTTVIDPNHPQNPP